MSIAKVWQRIWNAIAAATITAVNDTGPVMLAQVSIGYLEANDNIPFPQQFGFASVPPLQSDAALLFVGGDRSNGVGIATNNQAARFRNKQPGESVMHNAFGMSIYLTETGILINGGGMPLTITNTPTLIQEGDIHATGLIYQGFGGAAQVGLGTHRHGEGTAAAGTTAPTPGT